ncbi:MFS transporter [Marinococcus sp. PL1-022]|uniref:MFS transporter n=1 Tax=Marinococcus sp. PL1-022 TaxID=3095363 RepID=UPI0029C41C64|nr:MFS transporter [Marinococcus sp. PL1-022]MDX6151556.1 MFS transporter [Marinococcus sp. PL1-022]
MQYETGEFHSERLTTGLLFWSGLIVMSSLYMTIPLIPTFSEAFHISAGEAAWAGSIFSIFFAAGCLLYGPLSERVGRKRTIVAGLLVLAAVTLLLGMASTFSALLIGRALQGLAAASFSPVALAYIGDMFTPAKRGSVIGFISAGFLIAGIFGQTWSSAAVQAANWHWAFLLLGIIYVLTFVLMWRLLPVDPSKGKTGGKPSFVSQLQTVARNKSLMLCFIVTLSVLMVFVGMYSSLGQYLQGAFQLSQGDILYVRAAGLLGISVAFFTGKWSRRVGSPFILRLGLGIGALSLLLMLVTDSLWLLVAWSVLFTAGAGLIVPAIIALINQVGAEVRGVATSLYTFILFIGASIGPVLSTAVSQAVSVEWAFGVLALIYAASFVTALGIRVPKQ